MTTLLKPDGSYTSNLNETVQAMLDHLIATDDQTGDTEYHKRIRIQTKEPNQTSDDREFASAGHSRNELADKLAKEATKNNEICHNKIPKSEIVRQESEKTITKWQQHWDANTKGLVTKEYFPNIKERIKMKISLSPNFTALVTAHGKTKAYLHCFKIIQSPECICTHGSQTAEHLIFDCDRLEKERRRLIVYTVQEEDSSV